MSPYIVYVKTDEQNRICAVESSAFLTNSNGWREVYCGYDARCLHAQSNFFPKPLYDERGIPRYMTTVLPVAGERPAFCVYQYNGDVWAIYERTQDEINADVIAPAIDTFAIDLMAEHEYRICCLELGI